MAELNFRPEYCKDLKINIQVISHKEQGPAKVTAQWWTDEAGVIQVRISRLGDIRAELLHLVHELVEIACSITHPEIMDDVLTDAYDEEFLRKRAAGELPLGHEEVGFGENCPYSGGHHAASGVELMICPHMDLNWVDYDNRVCEVAFDGKEFEF